ncbi:Dna2/Cas4 domain-containing protein, partial [Prevotella pectinovora]|uniref:Dna2/Cas4 domain-containing protein n=1 Tax=Prevotella pectinovora TaxID=1602169 RepID=UPI00307B78FD
FWVSICTAYSTGFVGCAEEIQTIAEEITNVISQEQCPPVTKKGICKNCSYFEFCYINEMEEEE